MHVFSFYSTQQTYIRESSKRSFSICKFTIPVHLLKRNIYTSHIHPVSTKISDDILWQAVIPNSL